MHIIWPILNKTWGPRRFRIRPAYVEMGKNLWPFPQLFPLSVTQCTLNVPTIWRNAAKIRAVAMADEISKTMGQRKNGKICPRSAY
jgi:hypothetical protein